MKYRVNFAEGSSKEVVADNFYMYSNNSYDPATATFSRKIGGSTPNDPWGSQNYVNVAYYQNVVSVEVIPEDG